MITKTLCSFGNCSRNILVLNKFNKYFSKSAISEHEDSPSDVILVDKDATITLIGINRPKQRNSITFETAGKISNAISAFEADDSSSIAVMYGIGGSFCAGYDVKELEMQAAKGSLDYLLRHDGSVGPTRRHPRKPLVCAINGFCVAGGLELALMCDLRVIEESAILGFFNRRLGVPVSDGGTVRLSSIVGYSRALELLLSGQRITAKEALHMGLVNRVVATGTALGQAVNLAFCIAKFPQASLAKDRNSLYTNAYSRKGFRAAIQAEVMNTSREVLIELKEGVHRFKKSDADSPDIENGQVRGNYIPEWEKIEMDLEKNTATKS